MDLLLPPLIRALQAPACYPWPLERVDLLQTHGAWVLLAGDSAFKIKKPVQLDFMDFSTLALRRAACEAEIRVNRRFASDDPDRQIYREVLPIVGTPEAPRWGRPGLDDAAAIEFAVHMRRFDEAGRLDHLCERGALQPAHLVQLARRLAQVQAAAAVAPPSSRWGQPQTVQQVVQDNLQTLRRLLQDAAQVRQLEDLQTWTDAQWPTVATHLAERRAAGRVREGHGDLHLANLVLQGDEVLPFDAIEFNEALRWVDVAADLAFTWMDLQRMGRPGLGHLLISEWIDASGDVGAPAVLPFLAVYLALVRAKVAAIERDQLRASAENPSGHGSPRYARDDVPRYARDDVPRYARDDVPRYTRDDVPRCARDDAPRCTDDDLPRCTDDDLSRCTDDDLSRCTDDDLSRCARDDVPGGAGDDASRQDRDAPTPSSRAQRGDPPATPAPLEQAISRYLALAQSIAQPQPPGLLITHGLSGSGKSHAAAQWLVQHGGNRALRLRSDVERKRLFGLAPLQASEPDARSTVYGAEASARAYASLLQRAQDLLQAGWRVVVDAAFLRRHEREAFARLARTLGCPFAILAPQAPLDVLRQRVVQRQIRGEDPSEATPEVLERQLQWVEPLSPDEQAQVLQ